ncbi:MAG: tRNA (uridine(54)-C5)-methyltransferase TrmA, partial [Sphaerospermopsis sp. SIO1G2]|nr:tRNA (uridine(54)-C5)-methyltransferase TrmA [Sphaerospermopsis sp. SIO1G2]
TIQSLMGPLRDQLRDTPALRRKLFQVEFMATLAGDMLHQMFKVQP